MILSLLNFFFLRNSSSINNLGFVLNSLIPFNIFFSNSLSNENLSSSSFFIFSSFLFWTTTDFSSSFANIIIRKNSSSESSDLIVLKPILSYDESKNIFLHFSLSLSVNKFGIINSISFTPSIPIIAEFSILKFSLNFKLVSSPFLHGS